MGKPCYLRKLVCCNLWQTQQASTEAHLLASAGWQLPVAGPCSFYAVLCGGLLGDISF